MLCLEGRSIYHGVEQLNFLKHRCFFFLIFKIAIGDNSDAFEELLNDDGTKYYFNGEYHDLIIHHEDIKIKGKKEPYKLAVKKTRHGYLI